MIDAYIAATGKEKLSIRKAAQRFGVPFQTLRDRVAGTVDPECIQMGRSPVLSLEEEAKLVSHLKEMALIGYGYTRQEVVDLASEYAADLDIRKLDNPFSLRWFYSFLKRWPDLRVVKPRALEIARVKGSNKLCVDKYFDELSAVIHKYNLEDKPHLIYNVDEKGTQANHKPPNVVGSTEYYPPAVTAGRSETITFFGCENAAGNSIPPYFLYPGKKMQSRWMDGSTPGAVGTVSDSGWSNSQIFLDYLKHHFKLYVPGQNDKILLLLDGHKSHVSLPVIEWAQDNNIIIHVLPAHTSHFLQPMDVGIYGPLQKMYDSLCHKKTRTTSTVIMKEDVCQLACAAYMKSATPENLISAFKKTGIFPLNRDIIDSNIFAPAEVFHNENINVTMNDVVVNDSQSVVVEVEERGLVTKEEVGGMDDSRSEYGCNFFDSRFENVKKVKSEKVVKPRNTLSKVVSGRCITESDVAEKVRVHVSQQSKKSVEYTDRISKKSSEKEMGSGKKDCNLKGKGKRKIVKHSNKKNLHHQSQDQVICMWMCRICT